MLCVAGKCTQIQVLPETNSAGQQHMASKMLHSTKQAAFVFFYRVLEGGGKGAVLAPGTLEWTVVLETKLGEEKSMLWTQPGKGPTHGTYTTVTSSPPSFVLNTLVGIESCLTHGSACLLGALCSLQGVREQDADCWFL